MNKKTTTTTNEATTNETIPETNTTTTNETVALPSGYCNGGFMDKDSTGKNILKRDYIEKYAQELASMLANGKPSMKSASFKSAFLADAKRSLKRNVSTEARLLCAASMLTKAKKLTATRKAPKVLRDMINALLVYVKDDATFNALFLHLDAIYAEMLDIESTLSI